MRYVVATYNTIYGPRESIPFGVVVNDGSRTYYRFDTGISNQQRINAVSPQFDVATFTNFEQTFHDSFIVPGKTIITDDNGERREIDVNGPEFLDYLAQTYDGAYQYSKPLEVEGESGESVLTALASKWLGA
jgi:hypothetical protein